MPMLKKDHFVVGPLIDVYGELLSSKQRNYLIRYYEDNYTLEEIGEVEGKTRQCVYDVIMRGIRKMEKFEDKLQVLEMRKIISQYELAEADEVSDAG